MTERAVRARVAIPSSPPSKPEACNWKWKIENGKWSNFQLSIFNFQLSTASLREAQMLIENRIKYNETKQIVVYWEKLVRNIFKRFFRKLKWVELKNSKTISSEDEWKLIGWTRNVNYKTNRSFNPQPKNNYLRSSSKKAEFVSVKKLWRKAKRLFKRKRA